jgi:putative membrane protein
VNFIIRILIIAVNAFLLAWLLPGIEISDFLTAILVALVLAVLDYLLKPVLILLTLPATFLSFGLFLFVVNALIILLDAYFVHGFKVDGFWYAVLFSILLSIANGLVLPREKKQEQKGNW